MNARDQITDITPQVPMRIIKAIIEKTKIYYISFVWLSTMSHTYEFKFHLHITRYINDKLKRNVIKLINHVNMNIVYEIKY